MVEKLSKNQEIINKIGKKSKLSHSQYINIVSTPEEG